MNARSLAVTVVLGLFSLGAATAATAPSAAASSPPTITVGQPTAAAPIAPGFLGLALEYQSAAAYAGGSPETPNPVFEQLVRNLDPGQTPVLRIGGDSTDHTWWPAPGIAHKPGLTYALTPTWISTIAGLAHDLGAQLMLGINLEAGSTKLATAEAKALIDGIGRSSIAALQIGNEPNLYASFPWYTTSRGKAVAGRARGWSVSDYLSQYAQFGRALPSVPLAGPDLGTVAWMSSLGKLLRTEPRISTVTFHRYAGDSCYGRPGTPQYPSIATLLTPADSRGLAATIVPYVKQARAHHDGFRVDELNSEACSGKVGVSNAFASALWIVDTLFAMAQDGATGVNIQTFPSASYRLFRFSSSAGQWSGSVAPEYYGLLMFAQAAPPGSRLLHVTSNAGTAVRAWATAGTDGATRITLINDSTSRAQTLAVDLAGASSPASLERLEAPSVHATNGVTLGSQSFADPTSTGTLAGAAVTQTLAPTGGSYEVALPAGSAALLTVP